MEEFSKIVPEFAHAQRTRTVKKSQSQTYLQIFQIWYYFSPGLGDSSHERGFIFTVHNVAYSHTRLCFIYGQRKRKEMPPPPQTNSGAASASGVSSATLG